MERRELRQDGKDMAEAGNEQSSECTISGSMTTDPLAAHMTWATVHLHHLLTFWVSTMHFDEN